MDSNLIKELSIQSYIDKNRTKIDESLVSLRIMKQIDDFLEHRNLTNRELSIHLGYSESYISQLMSGIKNINVSFINKFEKYYDVNLDFQIYYNKPDIELNILNAKSFFNFVNDDCNFITKSETSFSSINKVGTTILFDTAEDVEYETIQ